MQRLWNAYYIFWFCTPTNPYEQILVLYNYIYLDSLSYWPFFCFLFFSEFPLINLGSFSLGTLESHLLYICCCWIPSAFYGLKYLFVFWRIFFSGENLSLPVIFYSVLWRYYSVIGWVLWFSLTSYFLFCFIEGNVSFSPTSYL